MNQDFNVENNQAKDQRKERSRQKKQLGKDPEETICLEYSKVQVDEAESTGKG